MDQIRFLGSAARSSWIQRLAGDIFFRSASSAPGRPNYIGGMILTRSGSWKCDTVRCDPAVRLAFTEEHQPNRCQILDARISGPMRWCLRTVPGTSNLRRVPGRPPHLTPRHPGQRKSSFIYLEIGASRVSLAGPYRAGKNPWPTASLRRGRVLGTALSVPKETVVLAGRPRKGLLEDFLAGETIFGLYPAQLSWYWWALPASAP